MNQFCSLPFRSMMTFNTGEVKPCCDALTMGGKDGKSLSDVWNGESWKELRRSFILNQRHAACQICWKKEDKGFLSGRETSFSKDKALEHCAEDGTMKHGPRSISLRLGNKCNLACIMCTPLNSSLWGREQELYQRHMSTNSRSAIEELDVQNKEFLTILQDIEAITFIGGEPLLFKQHEQILRSLIASGRAAFVELHYFTNTTLMPDWCLDLWKGFKKIKLRSSIDGVGLLYEYIRYPARWESIEKNIAKLTSAGLENLEYSFCYVLMNLNVFSLEEFFIWRNHFFVGRDFPIIRPDYLEEPDFLRPHYLPSRVKARAVESLQRTISLAEPEEKKLIQDMLEQVQIEAVDKEEKLSQLKKYLLDLDRSRKINHAPVWAWL